MNLRTKLALKFTLFVSVLFIISSVLTYFLFADYREDSFYHRLENKALKTAGWYADAGISDALLFQLQNQSSLPYVNDLLYNNADSLLFSTDINHDLIIDKNILSKINGPIPYKFSQGKFECIGINYSDNKRKLKAIVGAIDENGIAKMNYLLKLQIFGFIFGMIIIFIAGWFFAKNALYPIKKLISQVDNITANNLKDRIAEKKNNDEINLLIQTFNSMLERMEKSFDLQKNFIANASHEIRNPLTAITGQLEVALMMERNNETYKKVIESTLADSKNINILFNNLLMMAKTSNIEKRKSFEELQLDEVMMEARTEVMNYYPGFNIEIILSSKLESETQLTINGMAPLLKVAFINLLDNACKFSNHKIVKVEFDINKQGGLLVSVKNAGIGILPDDQQNIFNPFKRGKNVTEIKGHGIGLALVQNILTIHHADIAVHSEPGEFTVITMSFNPNLKFNRLLIPD